MPTFEDFFRGQDIEDTTFFDEGPRLKRNRPPAVNTSSIDMSAIDPYRQGVEITQLKHFDAGTFKIHSGEPGHRILRNRFGMDKNFRPEPVFQELDYFSPLSFIRAQDTRSE